MSGMAADDPPDDLTDIPASILADAAIWHARLREPAGGLPGAETGRAAFERWLRADPRNCRAFEETERLWAALEAPVAQVMATEPPVIAAEQSRRRPLARLAPRLAALAACLVVAIGAGLVWQGDVVDRLRSDHSTAVGERAPLVLQDGSRVTLNSDSAVAIDLDAGQRRISLLRGEAWFDVAPDSSRPFVVTTPLGSVQAIGTSFDVRLDGDTALVSLTEGRVELAAAREAAGHASRALEPGQQARITADGISAPAAFDETVVTAWLRGQLVFYDRPLAQVVAELNRYRPGHIVIVNAALEGLRVSGVFKTDDPEAALSVIADTLPVGVIRLTDHLVLLR